MKDRAPKKLTEIEPPIPFDDPHSKVFECPHCQARLQFKAKVNIFGVYELDEDDMPITSPKPTTPPKDTLSPCEREVVESSRKQGLIEAFQTTVRVSTPHNVPADLDRYFITFLTRATKIRTPQFAIRQCLPPDEREGELALYAFGNIAAVIKDGYLRTFLPYQLAQGKEIADTLTANGNGVQPTGSDVSLPVWVKTRNGYVVGRGELFKELRGKAAGAFANTGV